jgi:hypothetical protein
VRRRLPAKTVMPNPSPNPSPKPSPNPSPKLALNASLPRKRLPAPTGWPWVVLALAGAAAAPAHAARPLATDDAGALAHGICEIEAAAGATRLDEGSLRLRVRDSGALLACGLPFAAQWGLAYARESAQGASAQGLALTGKWQLWSAPGSDAAAVALSGALTWARDSASGLGWRREGSQWRLIGTLPGPVLLLHANLGHARAAEGGAKATLWGLAVEAQPVEAAGLGWAPLAEVYGDDRGQRFTAAGLRLTVQPERLFVDTAFTRQRAGGNARGWQAGLRWAF